MKEINLGNVKQTSVAILVSVHRICNYVSSDHHISSDHYHYIQLSPCLNEFKYTVFKHSINTLCLFAQTMLYSENKASFALIRSVSL